MDVIKTEQAAGPAAQPTRTAASVAAPRTSFAQVLAKSSAVTATKAPDTSKTAGAETTKGSAKAETTRKVAGHDYVEVMSGPRNGMFINTSHNERHGQAFVRVMREDRELHIYGSGKDRHVVTVMRERKAEEKTREVEGHDYVEVMSGPRNGMFINTSHNENHGKAFVLVHKRDHDLHIYGSGQDRRVIIDYNRTSDDAARKKTEAARTTGGVSAPSA
jgi:acid phosphatase family membrane protein YuiD